MLVTRLDSSVGPFVKVINVSDPPDSLVGPFVKVINVSDPPDLFGRSLCPGS